MSRLHERRVGGEDRLRVTVHMAPTTKNPPLMVMMGDDDAAMWLPCEPVGAVQTDQKKSDFVQKKLFA
jgi:hypothetical protein